MVQPYDMSLEELKKYKPELTRQPDFDEFWEGTKKELAAVRLEYKLQPYNYPARGVKYSGSPLKASIMLISTAGSQYRTDRGNTQE